MIPKVNTAHNLAAVKAGFPEVPLLPLIESAAGYVNLGQIAGVKGVLRLIVGNIDFVADIGPQCSWGERELAPLRFAVAMHTRMHGLASAVDGVTTSISDTALIRTDTQRALGFGLTANLCIHPKQVPVIHAALAPSQDALEWAGRVIVVDRAASGSAVQLDGCMVDMPVVMQARRMLARAFG